MKNIIIPISFTDDLEEISHKDNCNAVGIEEMSITYIQPADTNSSSEECQHLTITSRTALSPGMEEYAKKECFYFDITIPEGEHWSVDEGDSLKALVEDFKQRIYLKTEHNDTEGENNEGKDVCHEHEVNSSET